MTIRDDDLKALDAQFFEAYTLLGDTLNAYKGLQSITAESQADIGDVYFVLAAINDRLEKVSETMRVTWQGFKRLA